MQRIKTLHSRNLCTLHVKSKKNHKDNSMCSIPGQVSLMWVEGRRKPTSREGRDNDLEAQTII